MGELRCRVPMINGDTAVAGQSRNTLERWQRIDVPGDSLKRKIRARQKSEWADDHQDDDRYHQKRRELVCEPIEALRSPAPIICKFPDPDCAEPVKS